MVNDATKERRKRKKDKENKIEKGKGGERNGENLAYL